MWGINDVNKGEGGGGGGGMIVSLVSYCCTYSINISTQFTLGLVAKSTASWASPKYSVTH